MRKIYSLVLMAAALLVGTNVLANPIQVTSESQLRNEIYKAGAKVDVGTVQLVLANDITLTSPIWIHTTDIEDNAKSVELDLNGWDITMYGTSSDVKDMFIITHGELFVINNNMADTSKIVLSGQTHKNSTIFDVYGSYKSSRWTKVNDTYTAGNGVNTRNDIADHFTHLYIGQRVKLQSEASQGSGIIINELFSGDNAHYFGWSDSLNYNTQIYSYTAGAGLAQGVRVDIWGNIDFASVQANAEKCYAIKVNGMVGTSLGTNHTKDNQFLYGNSNYSNYQTHCITNQSAHEADTVDAPFVYIHKTAKLTATHTGASEGVSAVYAGGWAKWMIEGICEGTSGLNVKSGKVELHDATITSTYTDTYVAPTGGTGASGTGSAVVLNQTSGYSGNISVVVSGDTKVSSTVGAAIEEVVTSGSGNEVQDITITGGTLEGGNHGAITVTEKGAEVTTVYGASLQGDLYVEGTQVPATDITAPGSNMTTVKGEDGQTVIVINQSTVDKVNDALPTVNGRSGNVIWTVGQDTIENITGNTTLDYLEINSNTYHQTLIVHNNVTLTAGRVVLGEYAKIIVEAGGKLIVTGNQGIVAYQPDNIVLQNSESAQAIFLFNPAVTSNRHPKATVKYFSKAYTGATAADDIYQFFGVPMKDGVVESIIPSASDANDYLTMMYVWRPELVDYDYIGLLASDGTGLTYEKFNVPFGFYSMISNNPSTVTMSYEIQGNLVGNTNAELTMYNGWPVLSNAYTGVMNTMLLYAYMANRAQNEGSNIQPAIYTYEQVGTRMTWTPHTPISPDWSTVKTDPMRAVMFRNNGGTENISLSYENLVWKPATASAPARAYSFSNFSRIAMHVDGNDGVYDLLTIAQSEDFNAGLDIYDAEQYMDNEINLYVTDEERMAIFATNDLRNTYLGFACKEGGEYTLTFDDVEGEDWVLIDLQNNVQIPMSQGATYHFTANDNEMNDYRFKVVGRQEMPTDVENVEDVMMKTGGIYTLTGQYLGEMSVWDNLPAGLYIVNGEKKVK